MLVTANHGNPPSVTLEASALNDRRPRRHLMQPSDALDVGRALIRAAVDVGYIDGADVPVHEIVAAVKSGSAADQCERIYELLSSRGVLIP